MTSTGGDLWPLATMAGSGALVDAAMVVLAPHLVRSLHSSTQGIVGLVIAASAVRLLAGVFVAPLSRGLGRWRVSALGGLTAAVLTPLLALATSVSGAIAVVVLVAVAGAPIATAHLSLLADAAPSGGRARIFAIHAGGAIGARGVGAATLAGVAAVVGWKWALLLPLGGAIPAVMVLRRVDEGSTSAPWTAVIARLTRIRSRSALTAGLAVAGFASVGAPPIVRSLLIERHISTPGQGSLDVVGLALALVGLPVAGYLGDIWAGTDLTRLPLVVAAGLAVFGTGIALAAVVPGWALIGVVLGLALAGLGVAIVTVGVLIVDVVPPSDRVAALGLAGALAVFWGLSASVVADAARSAWGPGAVMALLGLAAVAAAGVVLTGRDGVPDDVLGVVLEAEERQRTVAQRQSGHPSSALAVSHVSFSYGTQPVLFDVSLRVEEGEIVALLGTNGAGKSTLLRLVAGLDHPHRGSVGVFGDDTTYVEAEQVLNLGVALLSGGRMTFPSLSVAENIRVGAQTRYRDSASWRRAEEEVYAIFPSLGSQRGLRAGSLSGGQQQMLALGRVLLLRPRLLLLDELTLGLAPMVVEQLLATVRRLNTDGASILLVEQSANLALSLAPRALFLERGAVRFDGPADELLTRDELLRPVFIT